jgi:hypothetical protein
MRKHIEQFSTAKYILRDITFANSETYSVNITWEDLYDEHISIVPGNRTDVLNRFAWFVYRRY